jgi:tRNA-splicing ligase RtcB (3'-phosphate/5'-hydroxy nucleic acid ligase)
MSRTAAKKRFYHRRTRSGYRRRQCRKDAGVIDETPGAYKSVDAVIEAERGLIDVVHTLKQVVFVKG